MSKKSVNFLGIWPFIRLASDRRRTFVSPKLEELRKADRRVSEKDPILKKSRFAPFWRCLFCIHCEEKIVSESRLEMARLTPLAEAVMSDD